MTKMNTCTYVEFTNKGHSNRPKICLIPAFVHFMSNQGNLNETWDIQKMGRQCQQDPKLFNPYSMNNQRSRLQAAHLQKQYA